MDRDMDLKFRKDIEQDLEKDKMPRRIMNIIPKAEDWEDLADIDVSENNEEEKDSAQ